MSILALERADAAGDDGNGGKGQDPPSPAWRATVVAHVRSTERTHAIAALPDGGLAVSVGRRLVVLDVSEPPPQGERAPAREGPRARGPPSTSLVGGRRLRQREHPPANTATSAAAAAAWLSLW